MCDRTKKKGEKGAIQQATKKVTNVARFSATIAMRYWKRENERHKN